MFQLVRVLPWEESNLFKLLKNDKYSRSKNCCSFKKEKKRKKEKDQGLKRNYKLSIQKKRKKNVVP